MFDEQRTSWLTEARNLDTEVYRDARDSGRLRTGRPKTDTHEMGVAEQQLAAIYTLLQQLIHVGARTPRAKAMVHQWPAPVTAADLVSAEDARHGYESVMADVVFIPRQQFRDKVAESQAGGD